MSTSKTTLLCTFALAVFFAACTVDDSPLDTRVFACTNDGSCGDGWGCKRATPYAVDFCAERCTPGDVRSCDGICTDDGLCLRGCQINPDGTATACPSEDYSCIGTSIESNSGVCYPVKVCAADTDCPAGQACLSEGFNVERLYCVPNSSVAECAAGSVSASDLLGAAFPYCFPTCRTSDSVCPPGFGCLTQLALFTEPACIPGVPGVSCKDDSNCLIGGCRDVGGVGRICTITCNDASRRYSADGCTGLAEFAGFDGLYTMECDTAAGGGIDGGLCSVRYQLGWPSCTPPGMAYPCASTPAGTECLPVDVDGDTINICSRSCTSNLQCNVGTSIRNYCAGLGAGSGICLPRGAPDDPCFVDDACRSDNCVGAAGTSAGACGAAR